MHYEAVMLCKVLHVDLIVVATNAGVSRCNNFIRYNKVKLIKTNISEKFLKNVLIKTEG